MYNSGKVVRFRRRRFRSRTRLGWSIRHLCVIALFFVVFGGAQPRMGSAQDQPIGSIVDDIASFFQTRAPTTLTQSEPQSSVPNELDDRRQSRTRSFAPPSKVGRRGRERCRSELPSKGESFSGPVTDVLDGDSLCVGYIRGGIEVRLGDFRAPELSTARGPKAKAVLTRIANGRTIDCVAGDKSYDRVVSVCTLDGRSLGDLMREAGIAEGGK